MNRLRTWRPCLAMIALVLYTTMAFAAGTVTQTISPIGGGYVVTFSWTADAADGSVPNTATSTDATTAIAGLFLARVETNPGATAPTDNYDITVLAASGVDLMAGALANRDTSNTEIAFPATSSPLVDGALTLTLSGNSVNSAVGTVKLYFTRSPTTGTSGTSGTVDPTPIGFTYTSTQTNAELVAAPAAGSRIVVLAIWITSTVTANVETLIGLHPTVTPASGAARVFSHAGISTTGGGHKQLGGVAIGVGQEGDALLITTGAIADGKFMVDVLYLVELIP